MPNIRNVESNAVLGSPRGAFSDVSSRVAFL